MQKTTKQFLKQTNNKSENKNLSHNTRRSLPYLNLTFLPISPLNLHVQVTRRWTQSTSFMSQIQLKAETASSSLAYKNMRKPISTVHKIPVNQKENKFDNIYILHQTSKCRIQSFPLNHRPILSEENYTLKKKVQELEC